MVGDAPTPRRNIEQPGGTPPDVHAGLLAAYNTKDLETLAILNPNGRQAQREAPAAGRDSTPAGTPAGNDASAGTEAPAAQKAKIENITIHSKDNLRSDTVAGTHPLAGETLPQFIKRLHPDLNDGQLAHQVKQMLKYNRDYGNDLGDGTHLDASKSVYLCSVKYLDASGHVSRIEGPTGRITEMSYGGDGKLSAYKITAPDGSVETGSKVGDSWKISKTKDGQTEETEEKSVDIDSWGDIILTDADGNQSSHLTNGTDVKTTYQDGKPTHAESIRDGQKLADYDYDYEGETAKIYATYADNPGQKVFLSEQLSPDALRALAAAQGTLQGPFIDAKHDANGRTIDYSVDLAPDGFVAQNIITSAQNLCGHAVTELESGISTSVGCARTATEALARAGFGSGIITANCETLENKLKSWNQGGHFVQVPVSQLKPADIIIGLGSDGKSGHTGIYYGNGKILANSTSKGYFAIGSLEASFGRFMPQSEHLVGYRFVPENK